VRLSSLEWQRHGEGGTGTGRRAPLVSASGGWRRWCWCWCWPRRGRWIARARPSGLEQNYDVWGRGPWVSCAGWCCAGRVLAGDTGKGRWPTNNVVLRYHVRSCHFVCVCLVRALPAVVVSDCLLTCSFECPLCKMQILSTVGSHCWQVTGGCCCSRRPGILHFSQVWHNPSPTRYIECRWHRQRPDEHACVCWFGRVGWLTRL
jgi:hypothetical protein